MMNKTYYFISGFPRAGNTLLSSILNQNTDITATGHSWSPNLFHQIKNYENNNLDANYKPNLISFDNVYKNIFFNFYDHIKTKYVVERSDWITPYNHSILEKYCPNQIKIVILVRDVLDIIKSYLKLCRDYPDFYINKEYSMLDKTTLYKDEIEEKADLIMKRDGYVDGILYSIKNLQKNNKLKNYLLIDYNDLISDTKTQLKKIYKYYEIPYFNHDLKNIKQIEGYNDDIFGAPLHTIKTTGVKKSSNDIKLSKRIIEKYKNLEFWKI